MIEGKLVNPQEHWLLAGVPSEIVDPVLESGQEKRYLPGDLIFREGDTADGLYLIVAGTARVTATAANGETLLAVVRPNEVLGEMGVLDAAPRSGTAISGSVCVAYFLPTEPVIDLLERSSLVCMRLLVLLTKRLRATNERLADLPALGTITHPDLPLDD
jgi:CRP/FNR family cyclic AMP-dependent transcriptional regulator